jgi:hypothetical protein
MAQPRTTLPALLWALQKAKKINLALVIWLVRGGGHNILFDSGYHRDTFLKEFPSTDYIRPDEAVKLAESSRKTSRTSVLAMRTGITWVASIFFQRPPSGFRRRSSAIATARPGSPAAKKGRKI